jgi:hypothetical protein
MRKAIAKEAAEVRQRPLRGGAGLPGDRSTSMRGAGRLPGSGQDFE